MEELTPLAEIFKSRIYRIPDYQRGYAWQEPQLRDFWEDLVNLGDGKKHYTGMLTIKEIPKTSVSPSSDEYWLLDDHGYRLFHVVDGQQRITTSIIFIQALIEILCEAKGERPDEILLGTAKLSSVIGDYLYKEKEPQRIVRTYKFGYTADNPSFAYMRHMILNEPHPGALEETFYTLNLMNAKTYFRKQLSHYMAHDGIEGMRSLLKKLTQGMVFNEYKLSDDLDLYVTFETMNNRGKKLSNLELLKNRLIYLVTLYTKAELPEDERNTLRLGINAAWKEVYHQLGRDKKRPLSDDGFLRGHWIMYGSRKRGRDYEIDLLEREFVPKNVFEKKPVPVELDQPEEQKETVDLDESDIDLDAADGQTEAVVPRLEPASIHKYVMSLKSSAVHWYSSHFPDQASALNTEEKLWLDRLNRLGMGYFRPLVLSLFLKEPDPLARVSILKSIERFVFVCFRLNQASSRYSDSEFCTAARALYDDRNAFNTASLQDKIEERMKWCFQPDGSLNTKYFKDYLYKKFNNGSRDGFYGWHGLRYFLYEYEMELAQKRGQPKLQWNLFVMSEKDRVSIEHIFPQTSTDYWNQYFGGFPDAQKRILQGSLGNLLPLSSAINSSLQNDTFEEKKNIKSDAAGKVVRNGYANGSYSEIQITDAASFPVWDAAAIRRRGLKLLEFMETRWAINLGGMEEKVDILNLKEIQ